jgi:putrescine transport system substrate-binding protein
MSGRLAAADALLLLLITSLLLGGCGRHNALATTLGAKPGDMETERVLNVYNWSDYTAPGVIEEFEREYAIKVHYDVFDSNEVLETKLLAGATGYDIAVPSSSFLERQIQAGVYQKLNKSLLTHLGNVDADMASRFALNDPGNLYSVNYLWGTTGIGYNVKQVRAVLGDVPVNSFHLLFDPEMIRKFSNCGVTMLDAPEDVISTVLVYLGRDPNSERLEDLAAAEQLLAGVRRYLRYIHSSRYIDDLANGEICLALGWSGDVGQARARASEAGGHVEVGFSIPVEGTIMFFDMLAIPYDAKHPKNAHLFIDYMLRPEVAARNAGTMHSATSNAAAYALIDPAQFANPNFYPPRELRNRLHANRGHTQAYTRNVNRLWTRFKSGL